MRAPFRLLPVLLMTATLAACDDDGITEPPTESLACNTTVGTLSPAGSNVTGVLTRESCRLTDGTRADRWRLVVTAPTILTIDMLSEEVDAFLIIRDAEGTLVAQNDDGAGGSDARITFGFAAGTYYVLANTYYEDEYGGYTLIVD